MGNRGSTVLDLNINAGPVKNNTMYLPSFELSHILMFN